MAEHESPLFVSRFGSGRPMLCIHGVEAQGLRYLGLASRLPGYELIAPDLRGHGRSPKMGPWGADQHLADLLPLLDAISPSALLLGHSLGGLLAWRLAGLRAESIEALILVDPAIALAQSVVAECTTYENSAVGHEWLDFAATIEYLTAARPPSGLWAAALDAATATERGPGGRFRPVVAPDAVRVAYEFLAEPIERTPWRGPTLLIEAGREHGRFVSPEVVSAMRDQLGDDLHHVVIDGTHTILSDYPDELAAAVASFLTPTGGR